MIGRKLGMMRLYDGAGRVRAVTVLQLGPNQVTQVRTHERDGYEAVQVGFLGDRKRLTRPQRGHLRAAGVDSEVLSVLREFPADEASEHALGEVVSVEQFEPGQYVSVTGTSKGRGFAGVVKRWHFHGGPKTHGQSDRHRAPGSIGAGTTPGKVWKGQKMGGHMGAETTSVLNLLVVQSDAARGLLFVEGSVPGPNKGLVTVTLGRKAPLAGYEPPELAEPPEAAAPEPEEPEAEDEATAEEGEILEEATAEAVADEPEEEEAGSVEAAEEEPPAAEAEVEPELVEAEAEEAEPEAAGESEEERD